MSVLPDICLPPVRLSCQRSCHEQGDRRRRTRGLRLPRVRRRRSRQGRQDREGAARSRRSELAPGPRGGPALTPVASSLRVWSRLVGGESSVHRILGGERTARWELPDVVVRAVWRGAELAVLARAGEPPAPTAAIQPPTPARFLPQPSSASSAARHRRSSTTANELRANGTAKPFSPSRAAESTSSGRCCATTASTRSDHPSASLPLDKEIENQASPTARPLRASQRVVLRGKTW